jgi:S-DNA-T family DNA segregation ATPase FtsK/SpoIIIE
MAAPKKKSVGKKSGTKAPAKTQRKAAASKGGATGRGTSRKRAAPKKAAPKKRAPVAKSKSKKTAQPGPPALIQGLSLDRKLDVAGVILTLIGVLVLLSLFSQSRSAITGGLITFLRSAFGLGVFLLPIGLVGIGLWLILRNFEQVPRLAFERLVGILLLYGNLLTTTHLLGLSPDRESSFALASAGGGGGFLGAIVSQGLIGLLGLLGASVALVSWLLIGLMLTLDMSLAELFHWVEPIRLRMKAAAARYWQQFLAYLKPLLNSAGSSSPITTLIPAPASAHTNGEPPADGSPGHEPEAEQWILPVTAEILEAGSEVIYNDDYDRQRAQLIEDTLGSFGAPAHVIEINRGPTITQFGVEPDFLETRNGKTRVRVNKISGLADDLALALAAERIRIQAPVPGKGYVGIEVPNDETAMVSLRDVIESPSFKQNHLPLQFALGQDVGGSAVVANLAAMPHLLVAGATGSGKSVCVNAIITCMLMHNTPDELRFIMVDPKRVELTGYNGIPHLLAPVVVKMERVVGALQWITREMDGRYQKFHDVGARNLDDYNEKIAAEGGAKLPMLVVIIDELADLMMLAPDQTEKAITRLAQLARATGIHLIIATQRPSVDVVTGLIKANFPARVAFAVSSGVDSRVILDQPGAERLLGRGDMLFQAPDAPAPVRLQGVFVSDEEIVRLVQYWRAQASGETSHGSLHSSAPVDSVPAGIPLRQQPIFEQAAEEANLDPMFNEAVDLVRRQGRASVSMLQRRLRIGYTRAARLVETMEEKGIVGPPEGGAQTRAILDYGKAAPPVAE